MGNLLSYIEGRRVQIDGSLLNCSQYKLIEYYSSYKSICEDFSMSVAQYVQIFGCNEQSYAVWDTDNRGRINAIQMFVGLVVFSTMHYQKKVKFLFEMFDFNQEGYLCYENLVYLLFNVCNATCKVFQISIGLELAEMSHFVDDYFFDQSKILFGALLRWSYKMDIFNRFFLLIGHQIEKKETQKHIAALNSPPNLKRKRQFNPSEPITTKFEVDSRMVQMIETVMKVEPEGQKLNPCLEWVYGIRVDDIKEPVKFMRVQGSKAASQRVIYMVGKIIVIYFVRLNMQKHYAEHEKEVSVLDISESKGLVASGQMGSYPSIHIWDARTFQSLSKLVRIHKGSIKLLRFIKDDQFLVSVSEGDRDVIVVTDIHTCETIISTFLQERVIDVVVSSQTPFYFSTISTKWVTYFSPHDNSFRIQHFKVNREVLTGIEHPVSHQLLTAHRNRVILAWSRDMRECTTAYQSPRSNQILQIAYLNPETLLILDGEDVEVMTFMSREAGSVVFERKYKQAQYLDLTKKYKHMFNLQLVSMAIVSSDSLLVLSLFGDLIRIDNILFTKQYLKYYQIFKMEHVSACVLSRTQRLLICSGNLLYSIDRNEHQLDATLLFDSPLTAIACSEQLIYAAISQQSKILYVIREDAGLIAITESLELSDSPVAVRITETHLLVTLSKCVEIFHRVGEKYFERGNKRVALEYTPLAMSPTDDPKTFLLSCKEKECIRLVIHNMSSISANKIALKEDKIGEKLCSHVESCIFSGDSEHALLINLALGVIMIGKPNGDVLLWNSSDQFLKERDSFQTLHGHSSYITQIILFQGKYLLTVGSTDGMLISYRHQSYVEENQQKPSSSISMKAERTEVRMTAHGLYDSHVELSIIQEIDQGSGILSSILKHNYKLNQSPALQIDNEYIYGFNCKGRKGMAYVHFYPEEIAKEVPKGRLPHSTELLYAAKQLLPYDERHSSCKREMVYFADKLAIVQGHHSHKQKFYTLHRGRITCLSVHPNKQLVCTCEAGSPNPVMHVWSVRDMATLKVIQTKHKHSIERVEFSRDGSLIFSLGGVPQSIQVSNWRNEEMLAVKYLQGGYLQDIQSNPYRQMEIVVCGKGILRVYEMHERMLITKEEYVMDEEICCMTYISSVFGSEVESDIITGGASGDIGLYICGKHILTKKAAHLGAINCLRVAEVFKYKTVLLSGGDDGCIRIWDIKFNQISRVENYLPKQNRVMALDLYQCDNNQGETVLLAGSDDGTIVEAKITNQFEGYQSFTNKSPPQLIKEKINLSLSVQLKSPSYHLHTRFAIQSDYLLTYSQNHCISLWCLSKQDLLLIFELPNQPSCCAFLNEQSIIICYKDKNIMEIYSLKTEVCYELRLRSVTSLEHAGEIISVSADRQWIAIGSSLLTIYQLRGEEYEMRCKIERKKLDHIAYMQFSPEAPHIILICFINQNRRDCEYVLFDVEGKTEKPYQNEMFPRLDYSPKVQAKYVYSPETNYSKDCIPITTMLQYRDSLILGTGNGELLVVPNGFHHKKYSYSQIFIVGDSPIAQLQTAGDSLYVSTLKGISILKMQLRVNCYILTDGTEDMFVENYSRAAIDDRLKTKYPKRKNIYEEKNKNHKEVEPKKKLKEQVMKQIIELMQPEVDVDILREPKQSKQMNRALSFEAQEEVFSRQAQIQPMKTKIMKFKEAQAIKELCNQSGSAYEVRQADAVIEESKSKESQGNEGPLELSLSLILGRTALYRRNNIFIDLKENIISHSGCNLLLMRRDEQHRLEQQFIKLDASPFSTYPQIGTLTISANKRMLFAGTNEENAKLIGWDISTQTNMLQIRLKNIVVISILKVSTSGRYAALLAINCDAERFIMFIDLMQSKVLASSKCYEEQVINDLCFEFNSQNVFIACGNNYMAQWNYHSGILNHQRYNMENPKDFISLADRAQRKQTVNFYSIIFVKDLTITSGSDGYLYLWKDKRIVKKQNAHPKEAILCLYTAAKSKLFASGGTDGRVIIWNFGLSLVMQKYHQFCTYSGKEPTVPLKYHVQSVCIAKRAIIVGNRAGEILEFAFDSDEKPAGQKRNERQNTKDEERQRLILAAFDHEQINSVSFSTSSQKIYILTRSGNFSVFDLERSEKVREEKIEVGKYEIIKMLVCHLSPRIFIVLKNSVLVYTLTSDSKVEKDNRLKKGNKSMRCDPGIKAAILSINQRYLALLVAPSDKANSCIEMYDLNTPTNEFYEQCKVFQNIPANIEIIDFSTDNGYLVYQNSDEEETVMDLLSKKVINTASIEFELEWNEEAKRTSRNIRDICSGYTQQNKLLKVVQVMNDSLIATDQMGSLRVYEYPLGVNQKDIVPSSMYIDHLNDVYICVLSSDSQTLVTVSKQDRALHIWKLNHSEKTPYKATQKQSPRMK